MIVGRDARIDPIVDEGRGVLPVQAYQFLRAGVRVGFKAMHRRPALNREAGSPFRGANAIAVSIRMPFLRLTDEV